MTKALAALLLPVVAVLSAGPARGADDGRIVLKARLEPSDLAPGRKGTLVVEARIPVLPAKLHLYADGEEAMRFKPLPAAGVRYGLPEDWVTYETKPEGIELTEPHEYVDPDTDDRFPVWEESFRVAVPIEVAADALPGTPVGLVFDYSGCTAATCYGWIRNHKATAKLGGVVVEVPAAAPAAAPVEAPVPAEGDGGAPPAPPPLAPPSVPAQPAPGTPAAPAAPVAFSPPIHHDTAVVSISHDATRDRLVVTFEPKEGYHLYLPDWTGKEQPIVVAPLPTEGLSWGQAAYPPGGTFEAAQSVDVQLHRTTATRAELKVIWQGCTEGQCSDGSGILWASWEPVAEAAGPPPTPERGRVVFPVYGGGKSAGTSEDLSFAERVWHENGILAFLILFGMGVGLAFTPCVLPIIPITVTVIAGGRTDIQKRRLALLLTTYVTGLSLAFGTMGLLASLGGVSISAAFEIPAFIVGMCALFFVLAFGMMGVYELQPPQWLLNLQGGAQKRAGSLLGAFLFGCLAAVIASPCTGPVIAGILLLTAKAGNALLGLFMFMTLGLGMGAVFFAAGSLNFAMKPGPWMVWVRYAFGAMLIGVALYYAASADQVLPLLAVAAAVVAIGIGRVLATAGATAEEGDESARPNGQAIAVCVVALVVGGVLLALGEPLAALALLMAALAWAGVAWHLRKKEGAEVADANHRGLQVGLLMLAAGALVWWMERPPEDLGWIKLRDVDHLVAEVEKAKSEGQAVVVDIWSTTCHNCEKYEELMAEDADIKEGFRKLRRLKIDVSRDQRLDLRDAVGMAPFGQPQLVFIDKLGRIRSDAYIDQWYRDESAAKLKSSLDIVLDKVPSKR